MKFLLFFFFILISVYGFGQNLVLNSSFEMTNIPGFFQEYISGWYRYQTVDYFSSISHMYNNPVPCNVVGCQYPRTGESYIGLLNNAFSGSNYREYIQTHLPQPLIPNQSYCVSFYISRSDTMEYASKDWGILFTDALIEPPSTSDYLISAQAQVTVPYFVTDDENWTLIQQIYTPTSPNEYLTIGNFLHDSVFPQQFVQASCSGCKQSYYYIDDVSVSLIRPPVLPDSISIYSGESIMIGDTAQDAAQYFWSPMEGLNNPNNFQTMAAPSTTTTYTLTKITACDTSEAKVKIEVLANENNITVMPNPNNNSFQVKYNLTEDADFVIYDALGRIIYQANLTAGSNLMYEPTIRLSPALYFLTLETYEKRLFQTKMVVGE
jgi:hypothetical protein